MKSNKSNLPSELKEEYAKQKQRIEKLGEKRHYEIKGILISLNESIEKLEKKQRETSALVLFILIILVFLAGFLYIYFPRVTVITKDHWIPISSGIVIAASTAFAWSKDPIKCIWNFIKNRHTKK